MSSTRRATRAFRAPRQPVPHWTRILARVLHDYDTLPVPTYAPIDASLITALFAPAEVSSSADERLLILSAYDGVGFVIQYGDRTPSAEDLFARIMQRYQSWDAEGVARLTSAGRARALEHLRSLLR